MYFHTHLQLRSSLRPRPPPLFLASESTLDCQINEGWGLMSGGGSKISKWVGWGANNLQGVNISLKLHVFTKIGIFQFSDPKK
jgi:hypothetical protein